MKLLGLFLSLCLAAGAASAAPPKSAPSIDLAALMRNTGVYHLARGAVTPRFVSDPAWPQPLPHNWLMGQVGGLFVDSHDHVWIYNRTRSLTNDEAGAEPAVPGAKVSGLGGDRAAGPVADCCNAAPAVMEFDTAGKLLRAWGGPADADFLKTKCREDQGCIWPNTEHGIYVDAHDNVWLAGNSAAVPTTGAPWITNTHGGDGFVLKFDRDGHFKMRIGGTPTGPDSNDRSGGLNGTPLMYLPADMVIDEPSHRLFIADGYGNRRVLIVDSETGQYIGHFGAYGSNPVDDKGAAALGRWNTQYKDGAAPKAPAFRNPVHCVKPTDDGKLYVCDRGNDRFQVFDMKAADLGKPCANPGGAPGKCGYLTEQIISGHTEAMPVTPGTATTLNVSKDKGQTCLYVGDNANQTIYILDRKTLTELGRLGSNGRNVGQFHWLHAVGVDKAGNLYTGEVDTGKRIQRFIRYGATGCRGQGTTTVGGRVKP
jgi:DNA-binding beta-propeller fold protein YncE